MLALLVPVNSPSSNEAAVPARPCVTVASAQEANRWFAEEVHAHDGQLKAWLRGRFPYIRDVDDVVQESYLRLWKVRALQPIMSAKAFLFTVAKRVAVDLVRRERVSPVSFTGDLTALPVLMDRPGVAETLSEREKLSLVGDAVVALPVRIRAVIILHKLQGVPQAEVAEKFGVSVKTVEHQVVRGVELCRKYLRRHGHEFF